MRMLILAVALLSIVGNAMVAQSDHPPIYLVGGYQATPSGYWSGLYKLDKTGPSTLVPIGGRLPIPTSIGSLAMDADNKCLLMAFQGTIATVANPWAGTVCRVDPVTQAVSTLARLYQKPGSYPGAFGYEYLTANIFVDQNGDYLFGAYKYDRTISPSTIYTYSSALLKYDRLQGTISSVITTTQLIPALYAQISGVGKDIDSGHLLFGDSRYSSGFVTYPINTLRPERNYDPRKVAIWTSGGGGLGWYSFRSSLEQNHRSGYVEGCYAQYVYQIKPGWGTSRTTLTSIAAPFTYLTNTLGHFDLQTAAKPSYKCVGGYNTQGTALFDLDTTTWKVTSTDKFVSCPPYTLVYNYQFDFYRGRHLQTVRTAPFQWTVNISVPHHPGKRYAIAAGISGIRPGIALPDGRRINLNADALALATLQNFVPLLWNPGPGVLDKNGEAKAGLDLTLLKIPPKGLGLPIWIAVVILDPSAPAGVAYLPDTYVMRV